MGLELAKEGLAIVHGRHVWRGVSSDVTMDALTETTSMWMKGSADVVLWQMQRIVWGTWDGRAFRFATDDVAAEDLLELRIFNRTEELHLRRADDALLGRYVQDVEESEIGVGEAGDYIDSFSRLWGKKADAGDGYVLPGDEDRKGAMRVPYAGDAAKADWYSLMTRNYIASDAETGLAGYCDDRFVAIEPAQEVK